MTPDVIGAEELMAKKSTIDQSGNLRNQPIEGVTFRATRPVPHEDGHVTEVARVKITEIFVGRLRRLPR